MVSVRTVENHLHRIYHKLGITARNNLKKGLDQATTQSDGTSRTASMQLIRSAEPESPAPEKKDTDRRTSRESSLRFVDRPAS